MLVLCFVGGKIIVFSITTSSTHKERTNSLSCPQNRKNFQKALQLTTFGLITQNSVTWPLLSLKDSLEIQYFAV